MTPLSELNEFFVQIIANFKWSNSGRFLLQKCDSIFGQFITSIQYIFILHEKFKRALHIGIIYDHQIKK